MASIVAFDYSDGAGMAPSPLVGRNHYIEHAALPEGSDGQLVLAQATPPAPRTAPLFFAIDPQVADAATEHDNRFGSGGETRLGASFIVSLDGGSVLTDGFLVADRENNILSDSFRAQGMLARYGFIETGERLYRHPQPATTATIGRAAVLGIQTNLNYFHWLFEALPRLELLREVGLLGRIDILAPPLRPWMAEMAALVTRGEDARLIPLPAALTRAETLLMPARGLANIQVLTPHALATVRNLRDRVDAPARGGRRLFVSRARSPSRQIANEEEIVALAERHGFERVYPETLSVAEQIATFRQAQAVAGALGAGLANAGFMAPGGALIELAPERRVGDATLFANMAHHLGLGYAGVVGPIVAAEERPVDRRDFRIDPVLAERAFASVS